MYTILISESNELITSRRERIMQRSKLVDNLRILADVNYKNIDMSPFTVLMEYMLPVSKEYHSEILTLSKDLYKQKLEYRLPFDTSLTKEAGDIELQFSFIKADLDEEGRQIQYVRKTIPTTITIIPISAWSDVIADSALNSIDQRIIQVNAMIGALEDMSQQLTDQYDTKADGLSYEDSTLQLTSDGKKIGNKVILNGISCDDPDGTIKVINF